MDRFFPSRSFSFRTNSKLSNPVKLRGFIQEDFPPPQIVSPQAGVFSIQDHFKTLNNKPSQTQRFFIQQDFPPLWIVSPQAGVFHPEPL